MRRSTVLVLGAVLLALLALLAWMVLRDGSEAAPSPPPEAPTVEPDPSPAATPETEVEREHVRTPVPATPDAAPPPAPVWDGPVATGRVIDAAGAPVPGARITSHPDDVKGTLDAETVGTEGSRSFVGTSAADGTFEMPVDPDGVSLVLTAMADGGFGQVAVTPNELTATISLVPWRSIVGRVTNTDDQPVAGATVRIHLLIDALVEERTATTDEHGAYEIGRLPPLGFTQGLQHIGVGRHGWIIAEADGYAPLLVPGDRKVAVGDDTRITIDLTLVRGLTLTGRIVDGDTRQPIPGATVVCWSVESMQAFGGASGVFRSNPVGPRPLGETVSDDDGSYRFENLPAKGPSGVASGNRGKRGMTMGHVAAWKDGYVYGGDEIPVSSDGAALDYDIELWPAATVEGRVVDAGGVPVEGVSVFAIVPERRPQLNGFPEFWDGQPKPWPKTDAEGRYRITLIRASRHAPTTGSVHASMRVSGSWVSAEGIEVTAMAGETVAAPDLVLPIGGVPRALVIVTDASGAPLAGVSVGTIFRPGRTDNDGRYEWASPGRASTGGDPKPTSVIVRAEGFAPQLVEFTPTRGVPVEVPVTMQPGSRISGRVTSADGSSVEGARVHVVNGARPVEGIFREGQMYFLVHSERDGLVHYGSATVGEDGAYTIESLPAGPYHVSAERASRAPTGPGRPPAVLRDVRSGVAAGTTDLLLTIPIDDAPPVHPLEVSVTDADGAPVETCTGVAVFGGPRIYAQLTSPGRLRFAALPAGEGRIEISSVGFRTLVIEPVVVEPDRAPEPMTVVLDRGVTLSGTVRVASGDLPDGAYVMARPARGDGFTGVLRGVIGADGTYSISGLSPGRYRLFVTARHGPRDATSLVPEGDAGITIAEVPRLTRDLDVVPAGSIAIQVADARFAPSPFMGGSATEEQKLRSDAARIEVVDASGALAVTFAPVHTGLGMAATVLPGDHVVRLIVPGEPVREAHVTVTTAESARVRFKDE